MNYIGGIDGLNINPITNYNKFLNQTKSFEVDTSNMDFENILQQQKQNMQNPIQIQGGIELNNIEDIAVQSSIKSSDNTEGGHFLKNVSNSISNGLNSVNNTVKAAEKAQEAFAMGENVSVHDVMIAAEKANLSMQMAMQLRNKLMNAYNEINSIRI